MLVPVSDVMSVCFPGAVARCCPGCPGMHRLRLRRAVPSAWCRPGVVICVHPAADRRLRRGQVSERAGRVEQLAAPSPAPRRCPPPAHCAAGSPHPRLATRESSALSQLPTRPPMLRTGKQGGLPGGPSVICLTAANTDRRAQRQQEATLRSGSPRQAKLPGSHPTCARRHGQPAPILPAKFFGAARPPRRKG